MSDVNVLQPVPRFSSRRIFLGCWLGLLFVYAHCAFAESSSAPQKLIDRVLAKADKAFAAQQYTQPQHDNALDRYNAVLMIDPNNERAQHGLKLVRNAYIIMADKELELGSLAHARRFLAILDEHYPQDLEVAKLRQRVRKHQPQPAALPDVANRQLKEFLIDPTALKARNQFAKSTLELIADRVADTKESVLILARNDAEGRWMYQTMNKATPEYRVRGDIRIVDRPAIQLKDPL